MKRLIACLAGLVLADACGSISLAQEEETRHSFRGLDITVQSWRGGDAGNPAFSVSVDISQADGSRVAVLREPIDGWLSQSWVGDLDSDGNPEVIFSVRSMGTGGYEYLYFHEFEDGGLRRHELPPMPQQFSGTYRGHDTYTFSADDISHRFPLYGPDDPNCCPTGGDAEIEYAYMANRLFIKDID